MPEPKGMKGDILGENDILGADTVTLGLTNGKRGNNASHPVGRYQPRQ